MLVAIQRYLRKFRLADLARLVKNPLLIVAITVLLSVGGKCLSNETSSVSRHQNLAAIPRFLVAEKIAEFDRFELTALTTSLPLCESGLWKRTVTATVRVKAKKDATVRIWLINGVNCRTPVAIRSTQGVNVSGNARFEIDPFCGECYECVMTYSLTSQDEQIEGIRFAFPVPGG